MFIARCQSDRITNIHDGRLFRFADNGNRSVYVMISNRECTYRHRSKPNEVLTIEGSFTEQCKVRVIEVFETEELTPECQAGFEAMIAKAEEIGWPSAYKDDLFIHDRMSLAEHKPKVFGWSVRETGTHIMVPDRTYSLFLTGYLARGKQTNSPSQEFLWNGSKLVSSDCERIEAALLKHSCSVIREFARTPWYDKSMGHVSGLWQQRIDRELEAARTKATAASVLPVMY